MVKIQNVRKLETEKKMKKKNPGHRQERFLHWPTGNNWQQIGQQTLPCSFFVPCSLWTTHKLQIRNLWLFNIMYRRYIEIKDIDFYLIRNPIFRLFGSERSSWISIPIFPNYLKYTSYKKKRRAIYGFYIHEVS